MKRFSDQGSASVHGLWVALLLVLGALVMAQVVSFFLLSQRVSQAADLAALAASRTSVAGGDPCAVAAEVANHNGARLSACRLDADVATVSASVELGRGKLRIELTRRARAVPEFYLR